MRARLLTVLSVLLFASACSEDSGPTTQLIVIINSDLTPVSELARVEVSVEGAGTRTYEITTNGASTLDGGTPRVAIPFSFGVSPPAGDSTRTLLIRADALAADGHRLLSTAARVGFVRHATRVLTLSLVRSCTTVVSSCTTEQTCREASCVPVDVDVASLPPGKPRQEFAGVVPLAPTCTGECREPAASSMLDASLRDAGPRAVDGAVDAGPQRVCRRVDGTFDDVGRTLTRSLDNVSCPIAAHSEEFGQPASGAADNLLAAAAFVRRAIEVEADILSFNVAQVDGELLLSAYPNPAPKLRESLPTLEQLLGLPELSLADQVLRLSISEPVADEELLAQRLLATLAAHDDVIHGCRPLQLWSEGTGSGFRALLRLRELLLHDPAHTRLLELLHFGGRNYCPVADVRACTDKLAEAGFEFMSLERRIPELLPALSYAQQRGLSTNIAIMYGPHMAANLCGVSTMLESLVVPESPEPAQFFDELHTHVRGSLALVDLDVREASPDATELRYRGLPAWALLPVAVGDGSGNLPRLKQDPPTDRVQLGDRPYLSFEASKGQSLALHDADNDTINSADPNNPYPRLTVSAVVRFRRVVLMPGERQVIVSKRHETTGWALELVNEGAGTMLRFVYFATGLDDNTVRSGEAVVMASDAALETSESYYVYAHFLGEQIALIVAGQESNEHPIGELAMGYAPRPNNLPVTLGADPGASSGFFDGDLQLVRVVSSVR